MRNYSFAWVTGIFFLFSLAGHWTFGWFAYVDDQTAHSQVIALGPYFVEMARDTFENWQSEFLQLIWQVAGLAYLYYAGSPQSRGDEERVEAKLDAVLRRVEPDRAEALMRELEQRFPKH